MGSSVLAGHSRNGRALGVIVAATALFGSTAGAQEPSLLRTLTRDSYSSNPPAFSPDGQRLAIPGATNVVVWNVVTGAQVLALVGHTRLVTVATYSPDGLLIASGSSDSTVRIWDASTGAARAVLRGHQHEVTAVVFSRDGSRLASGSFDGAVMEWDVAQGRLLWARTEHRRAINDIAFLADGSFSTASGDGAFLVWSSSGAVLARAQAGGQGGGLAPTPDGRSTVHGTFDGNLLVRDAAGALTRTIATGLQIFSLAVAPDGRRLAVGASGGVSVWDLQTGTQVSRWAAHGSTAVMDVGYSPDGSVLATSASDRTVKLWPTGGSGAAASPVAAQSSIAPSTVSTNALKTDITGVGGSSSVVSLAALGMTVTSPDATRWTSTTQDLGSGRTADALIGTLPDGSAITFSVVGADATTSCETLLNNAASRDGARRISGPPYVPTTAGSQAVQTASGGSLFCIPTARRPLLFSVTPATYSTAQQLSVRLMAFSIGQAAGAVSSSTLTPTGPGAAAIAAGLTSSIRFSELGLTIGVLPGSGWYSTVATASSGNRMDQAHRTGSNGTNITVTMSRLAESGTTCVTALAAFTSSETRVEANPAWLASNWFPSVVSNARGSFVCLPLANGVLVGSISRFNPSDNAQVRVLLIGLRLAAIDRWGAP